MKELARSNQEITRKEVSAKQALKIFKDKEENYKLEIINQINPEDTISLYTQTNFTDLCRGPHVSNLLKLNTLNYYQHQVHIGVVMKKIKCYKEYMVLFHTVKKISKSILIC